MATVSSAFVEELEEILRSRPLKSGELREVPYTASYYMSLDANCGNSTPMFSIEINETPVFVYFRKPV